jgi:hypothetical protein
MIKRLALVTVVVLLSITVTAQDRAIARGATSGELYLTTF